jgi:hypothetical protein
MGCSKEEAVSRLNEIGYKATNEGGVVFITIPTEKYLRKAQIAIKQIDYKSSWGIRVESEKQDGH